MGERMHQNPWKVGLARLVFTVGLLGSSSSALALGLGRLTLHSALDEPLRADIELTAVHPNDLRTLVTGLAARSEFDNAGVELAPHLRDIKYQVEQRPDGRYFLRLSSLQPVREPFLHFLLQVEWAGGRMIREYTALLDPPQLAAAARAADAERAAVNAPAVEAPIETAPAAAPAPAATAPESPATAEGMQPPPAVVEPTVTVAAAPNAEPVESDLLGPSMIGETSNVAAEPVANVPASMAIESEAAVTATTTPAAATPAVTAVPATPTQYGPVRKGDNLSKIVRGLGQSEFSLEQMAVALFRANKGAFYGNNLNNLKVGKILSVPSGDTVAAVSRQQALKELRGHNDAWREYKQKLAAAAQARVVPAEDKVATTAAPAAKSATAPAAADNKTAAKEDLLRIVRGSADANGAKAAAGGTGAEQRALRDKVATLEEAITSRELENKELRDRVAQLEEQVKNAQRLIQLENQTLAKAQKEAAKPAPAATPAAKAPLAATANAGAKPAEPAAQTAAPTTATAPPAVPAPAAANTPAARPTPVKKPSAAPVVAPVEEPSFLAGLLENPLLMPAAGGVLVLAFIGVLLHFRRRRKAIAEFGESILSGGINMNSEGNSANSGNAGEVSFLSDFSQGGMGNIHTDEVDPIAEAEVYLAYGRDEQAEEILKEAVVKDPSRHELRLKLLEIYHQRNDLSAFETVAEELYAALEGKGGKIWARVEELGHKMNPQNPLFRGGSSPMAAGAAAVGMAVASEAAGTVLQNDTAFDLTDAGTSAAKTPAPAGSPAAAADEEFSFDIDFAPGIKDTESPAGTESSINATVAMDAAASVSAVDAPAPTGDVSGIEFDFSSLTSDTASASTSTPASDDLGISFDSDLSLESAGASAGGTEISFEEVPSESADDTGVLDLADGGQIDEAATKLDLAKAYLDMGDAEGAKSILDEVLVEGSEVQRKQAAALAAQIAA